MIAAVVVASVLNGLRNRIDLKHVSVHVGKSKVPTHHVHPNSISDYQVALSAHDYLPALCSLADKESAECFSIIAVSIFEINMQQPCNIESTPLLKILLHAAKYPALAINGLLLGTLGKGGDRALQISDAVPLFHGQLHLAMALETALLQVIRNKKSNAALPSRPLHTIAASRAPRLNASCTCVHAQHLGADAETMPVVGECLCGEQTAASAGLVSRKRSDRR